MLLAFPEPFFLSPTEATALKAPSFYDWISDYALLFCSTLPETYLVTLSVPFICPMYASNSKLISINIINFTKFV